MDNILMHYASKYYDPQKAHEYYEQHKKLKGRTSTAGLNEKGREAAKYVKKSLNEEKKTAKEDYEKEREEELVVNSKSIGQEITNIRNRLEHMSAEEKSASMESLSNQILLLQAQSAKRRTQIMEKWGLKVAGIGEEYDEKYAQEIDKLKADPEMQAQKKGKKGKSAESTGDYEAWVRQNKSDYKARREK